MEVSGSIPAFKIQGHSAMVPAELDLQLTRGLKVSAVGLQIRGCLRDTILACLTRGHRIRGQLR